MRAFGIWTTVFACLLAVTAGCTSEPPVTKPAASRGSTTSTDSSTSTDTTSAETTSTDTTDDDSASSAASGSGGAAGGFGDLVGRFVLDGTAPTPTALTIDKDREVCGKHDLVDEGIVVGDGGGLANVAVYLYLKSGAKPPEPHPSYAEADKNVILDNLNCRFEPHICCLTTTQTLLIGNKDPVGHNTKIDTQNNPAINENLPTGAELEKTFSKSELRPAAVSCSIHPWMRGYLIVRESPYFAVTDETGSFKIANLPAGDWKFQVWHEKKIFSEVKVGGKTTKWSKGRFDVDIKAGENNLGDVVISAAALQ